MLHKRGINVSHKTVSYWWNRFNPMFASEIRRKRVQQLRAFSTWKWHVDEFFAKINGKRHYLWRAFDQVRDWITTVGAKTAFIEPGSPWENGYVEGFNARFRDELLNRELFYSLREAQIIIEGWRNYYNKRRPHSALGYRPPAPEPIVPMH